jgi:hypothetical protein
MHIDGCPQEHPLQPAAHAGDQFIHLQVASTDSAQIQPSKPLPMHCATYQPARDGARMMSEDARCRCHIHPFPHAPAGCLQPVHPRVQSSTEPLAACLALPVRDAFPFAPPAVAHQCVYAAVRHLVVPTCLIRTTLSLAGVLFAPPAHLLAVCPRLRRHPLHFSDLSGIRAAPPTVLRATRFQPPSCLARPLPRTVLPHRLHQDCQPIHYHQDADRVDFDAHTCCFCLLPAILPSTYLISSPSTSFTIYPHFLRAEPRRIIMLRQRMLSLRRPRTED